MSTAFSLCVLMGIVVLILLVALGPPRSDIGSMGDWLLAQESYFINTRIWLVWFIGGCGKLLKLA